MSDLIGGRLKVRATSTLCTLPVKNGSLNVVALLAVVLRAGLNHAASHHDKGSTVIVPCVPMQLVPKKGRPQIKVLREVVKLTFQPFFKSIDSARTMRRLRILIQKPVLKLTVFFPAMPCDTQSFIC